MRAGGFPGNPGGLVVSIVKTAGGRGSVGVRSPLSSGTGRCICGGYGRKVTRLTLGDLRACLVRGLPRGSPMGAQKSAEGRRVVAATRGPNT